MKRFYYDIKMNPDTHPENLRRYVVLAALQYGEKLKKERARVAKLKQVIEENQCSRCDDFMSGRSGKQLCKQCGRYMCIDCSIINYDYDAGECKRCSW
jgi:hypothetical protein